MQKQAKVYMYLVFFLSIINISERSCAYAESGSPETAKPKTLSGGQETLGQPKETSQAALPGILQKLLGQNQPIFQEEIETTQLKQHLETINNIGKIEDKIILYSIYDTFYFSVLQQNQQPISADIRENLYTFKGQLKKQILADKISNFTKIHAKPPLEAEKQAMEHGAEQYYDHVIAISLEEKLERIQGMEKVYVAGARDEKERQARRLMFDWTQLRIADIMQARETQKTSFWKRHRRKILAVTAILLLAGGGFGVYQWLESNKLTVGGERLLKGKQYLQKPLQDIATGHAKTYLQMRHFDDIDTTFNPGVKTTKDVVAYEQEFWKTRLEGAWEYVLEALQKSPAPLADKKLWDLWQPTPGDRMEILRVAVEQAWGQECAESARRYLEPQPFTVQHKNRLRSFFSW